MAPELAQDLHPMATAVSAICEVPVTTGSALAARTIEWTFSRETCRGSHSHNDVDRYFMSFVQNSRERTGSASFFPIEAAPHLRARLQRGPSIECGSARSRARSASGAPRALQPATA